VSGGSVAQCALRFVIPRTARFASFTSACDFAGERRLFSTLDVLAGNARTFVPHDLDAIPVVHQALRNRSQGNLHRALGIGLELDGRAHHARLPGALVVALLPVFELAARSASGLSPRAARNARARVDHRHAMPVQSRRPQCLRRRARGATTPTNILVSVVLDPKADAPRTPVATRIDAPRDRDPRDGLSLLREHPLDATHLRALERIAIVRRSNRIRVERIRLFAQSQ
jgi:hypothetical protein